MYRTRHSFRTHNWLIHQIHDAALMEVLNRYAKGVLLDIGCGEKPYRNLTDELVSSHFGLDHPGSFHNITEIDIFANAYATGFASNSIDTVLCTFVLEHLEDPQNAIKEIYRILRPGGYLILSVPLYWHLHEEPRDFYRYTKYGLMHLFTTTGFEIVEIKPLAGFIVTFGKELVYFLNRLRRGPVKYPVLVEAEKKRNRDWAMKELGINLGVWFVSNIHPAHCSVEGCPNADKAVRQSINFPSLLR